MADYTTTELLTKIKKLAAIPNNQPAFTTARLLQMCTDEMIEKILPIIISYNEGHFVTYSDFTITSTKSKYQIPTRAIGSKLREVKFVNNADTNDLLNVPILNIEDISNREFGFYIQGNYIVILSPEDWTNYKLRMYYYSRPGELIQTSEAAQITAYDSDSATITVSSVPSDWSTSTIIDVIESTSPFSQLGTDITISDISSNVLTVSSVPDNISIGDYLAEAGQSPVPNLPLEFHILLAHAVVLRVKKIIGNGEEIADAEKSFKDAMQLFTMLSNPRVRGEIPVINNAGLL